MTIKKCKICLEKTKLKKFISFGDFPYANFPVNLRKLKIKLKVLTLFPEIKLF